MTKGKGVNELGFREEFKYDMKNELGLLYRKEINQILEILNGHKSELMTYSKVFIGNKKSYLRKMLKIYNGKLSYELFGIQRDKNYQRVFALSDMKEYNWIHKEGYRFLFTIDELPSMLAFHENVLIYLHNYDILNEVNKKLSGRLYDANYNESLKDMLAIPREAMNESLENMRRILNPLSRVFYDERTQKQIFEDEVYQLIDQTIMPNSTQLSKKRYQLESIAQLQQVIEDNEVTKATKLEAEKTLQLIQKNLDESGRKQRKEGAEMNAKAVIQASKLVHRLEGCTR